MISFYLRSEDSRRGPEVTTIAGRVNWGSVFAAIGALWVLFPALANAADRHGSGAAALSAPLLTQQEVLSDADRAWIATHAPVRFGLPKVPWPPFDVFTPQGEHTGITADYLALLVKRLELPTEQVEFSSFSEALDALREGRIDLMGSIARTPDREAFAVFTLPYIRSQPVIIARKDNDAIRALADLAGQKIAIEKGFASREFLKSIPNIVFVEFSGTLEALQAVSTGRADAYVGSLISATYMIDREALSNLEVRAATGAPISDIGFAVRRDLPELVRLLDHGIASISEDEQATIRRRWIALEGLGVDWAEVLRVVVPIGVALVLVLVVILVWNRRLRAQVGRRRAAEAALAKQMSFQMALLEHLPALVAYKDSEARFSGCNRAYEDAFGVSRDHLIGKTSLEIEAFPEEQRRRGYAEEIEQLRTGELLHREDQLIFADGRVHDLLLWRIPFNLPDGTPAGLLSISVDVTGQKQAERAVANQLAHHRALINTIPSPIYIKDDEARFLACNRAYEAAFGRTIEDILGCAEFELPGTDPQHGQALYQRDLELLRTQGQDFRADVVKFADGKPHDVLYWLHSFVLPDGGIGGLVGALVDISETKALERLAQEAEKRLSDIANSVPGVVYQLRIEGDGVRSYTFMSDAVRTLRGVGRDEALRDYRLLWDQVVDEDKPGLDRAIGDCVAAGRPMNHEFRIRLSDGSVKWLQSAAEPARIEDGATVLNGYWIDVTQHRDMEIELAAAKTAADAANQAKSSFLASMSHEIRTPMNGVLGMLELLSLTSLDSDQQQMVRSVRDSGRSLLQIINDILDFSKIEAGKLDITPEPTAVATVIGDVFNLYSGLASAKDLLLTQNVDPALSPALIVDGLRLRQILNNFVSNAVKFTTVGQIDLAAELIERRDERVQLVRFRVSDTGIGISEENQKKLFQPFVQAEDDTTRRFGGTGLGLAICRRLAELMGGTIEMDSAVGRGTTMRLELVLAVADERDVKTTESTDLAADLRPRRVPPSVEEAAAEGTLVLVADDHPVNRTLLRRQLMTLGYAAEFVENGMEALDAWRSGRFSLLLTDCNMPEMDGYQLSREIRRCEANNGGAHIPIVACTANALAGEIDVCLAAGMDDYLAKPVELPALIKVLDRWLPLPEGEEAAGVAAPTAAATRAGAGAVAETPAGGSAPSPIDRAVLAEISGGDAEMEREILLDLRGAMNKDTAALAAALTAQDMAAVTRLSHRVKGASRMVGALRLAEASESVEHAGRAEDWAAILANSEALQREMHRLNDFLSEL